MSGRDVALVEPEMLSWGRQYARLPRELAAKKAKIKLDKLEAIESGATAASLAQVRKLAHTYQVPFGVFFLPSPPQTHIPEPRDFRRIAGQQATSISPELWAEYRAAYERREILLDITSDELDQFPVFGAKAKPSEDPEVVGLRLREYLGITLDVQADWATRDRAFFWMRSSAEAKGVLVFQFASVPVSEARGFAISENPFPIAAVNRKDPWGRAFSLLHELCHLMLQNTSLSNIGFALRPDTRHVNRAEVFCNHVAGAALVPLDALLQEVSRSRDKWRFDDAALDNDIERVARLFSVSREVVARRLLIANAISSDAYNERRARYQREQSERENKPTKKKGGFLPPARDAISKAGKLYPRLLIEAVSNNRLTPTAAASYLGVKVGQFDKIASLVAE